MTYIVFSSLGSESTNGCYFKEFFSTSAKSPANYIDWMANKEI